VQTVTVSTVGVAREVLRAGRWGFGTVRARDRGGRDRRHAITSFENAYGRRCVRQEADHAGERNEGGIGAAAGVAHLACRLAFAPVMHRTDLSRQQSGAAVFVVVGCRHGLAAERERRGDDTGHLAPEPETDHPRKTATNDRHGSE